MTLQQLRYIIEIVKYGSITEAAKQLYITQPSLSNAVRDLEEELSIEIFHRSSKGIVLTLDGSEFLSYARQVIEQSDLLLKHYKKKEPARQLFAVSTQHYAFAVNAFVELVKESNADEYEFVLRETRTHDIILDVENLRSELGILYMNEFNEKVLNKLFKEKHIEFHYLFTAKPHVFISKKHPLAVQPAVTLFDLEDYPCLSFEQGEYNSFYFSEEILSTIYHKKSIHVSDRATLFNLLIGLNGYTICSGILSSELNGSDIIAIPLVLDESLSSHVMKIGYITNEKAFLSAASRSYIAHLIKYIS